MFNLFLRNFATLPLTNDRGEHVGALFGCLQSYAMYLEDFKPDIVLCAWEGKGSAKRRREILKEYKEGRKFTGFNKIFEGDPEAETAALKDQLKKLREYLTVMPFYQASVDFLEADDLIACCTQHVFNDPEQFENIIVSCDKDYIQLVNEYTALFRPVKTKKNRKGVFETVQTITEDLSCHPNNYILVKSIIGDTSDAIKGIAGVGIKTVVKNFPFLKTLKESDDIYNTNDIFEYANKRIQEDKDVKYQKYIDNKDLILRNYELMQLLAPNVSAVSMKTIEQTFTNFTPRFKNTQFRIMLLRDNISPKRIDKWIDLLTNLKPTQIQIQ